MVPFLFFVEGNFLLGEEDFMYTNDEEWLVQQYSRLLHKMATKYRFKCDGVIEHDDLYQVASIGLLLANRVYDPSTGNRFMTIAYPYIIGQIHKTFRNVEASGKKVTRAAQQVARALHSVDDLSTETLDRLREKLGVSELSFEDGVQLYINNDFSMDKVLFDGGSTNGQITGHDVIGNMQEYDNDHVELHSFIGTLNEREQVVVKMYSEGYTQSEIGARLGVSQVHVSRMLKKIQSKGKEMLAV